jgi:hypothetical protein
MESVGFGWFHASVLEYGQYAKTNHWQRGFDRAWQVAKAYIEFDIALVLPRNPARGSRRDFLFIIRV